MNPRTFFENFDFVLSGIVLLLLGIGFMMIYSASMSFDGDKSYYLKQLFWMGIGFAVFFATIIIDYRFFLSISFFIYFCCLALLVYVLMKGIGNEFSSVNRWVRIFGFYVQPSEFTKLGLILYLAKYFSDGRKIGNLGFVELIWPGLVIFVPFVLILKQPDLGTAMMLLFIGLPILYYAGLRYKMILMGMVAAIITVPIAWFYILKEYQKKRILTLLDPGQDPLGSGYHIIQSKIAIGSGEVFGKGFLQGSQAQLNFLPARHTDFIFSVLSEEWGFVGSILVLLLFFLLVQWSMLSLGRGKSRSASMLSLGIAYMFFIQITINIGMVTGLMPVVGMPLPFMSYGGSSLLVSIIAIGLIINIRLRQTELGQE